MLEAVADTVVYWQGGDAVMTEPLSVSPLHQGVTVRAGLLHRVAPHTRLRVLG